MQEKSVPLGTLIAYFFWTLGLGLALLDLLTNWVDVGALSVVITIAGATIHIRSFLDHLAYRERNAFEIGRDYERRSKLTSL